MIVSNPVIQFVSYEQMSRLLLRGRRSGLSVEAAKRVGLTAMESFVIGAIAKALATVGTYPMQVAKSRMQAEKGSTASGMAHKIADMWRHEGWSSFYRGMNAKLSQTVLTAALMFAIYEKLVVLIVRFLRLFSRSTSTAVTSVAAAAVAVAK